MGWLTALAPVLMGALLWYVSGIPLLEAHLLATRSGYADYMRTTSARFPATAPPNAREESMSI